MRWVESIDEAISYIEENIKEELSIGEIARQALISPFYFQKGFAMLCGFTISEYIRSRRLALAGGEVASTDKKIIDIALEYGFDSPDSFTKAFTRFHGATPTAVRRDGAMIKSFAPLKIKLTLEGGYVMDYKIVEKEAFALVGMSKVLKYDEAETEIPQFWAEVMKDAKQNGICGTFGVNLDESMGGNEFEYLIADNYNPGVDVSEGLVTKEFPKHTWAVFPCVGSMPKVMQEVNKKIFSEWLPTNKEFEIAAGCCIEMYSDPNDYAKGTLDEKYYSEMWIPVKRK